VGFDINGDAEADRSDCVKVNRACATQKTDVDAFAIVQVVNGYACPGSAADDIVFRRALHLE
jgi:hypothetical protein